MYASIQGLKQLKPIGASCRRRKPELIVLSKIHITEDIEENEVILN